jgi:hypothetical protein
MAPGSSASPAGSSAAGAIPSFNLSDLSGAIPGLDSYKSSFTTGGLVQYQTIVVTKPVLSKAITTYASDGTTIDSRIVIVGDQAWTADGPTGAFSAIPGGSSGPMLAAFDPTLLLQAYSSLDFAHLATDKGVENKNGISAHHLRIDSSTLFGGIAVIPAGTSIDIWVADSGYVVAWEMTGLASGSDVAIEITNVNDPANVVTAPTP